MLTSLFVTEVRRQGSISAGYSDADILADGDKEVRGRFVSLLESVRQNYLVRTINATTDSAGRVPIPERAVAASLRSVQLSVNGSWVSLPQRDMEAADFQSGGQPCAYFLDGGSMALLPSGSSGQLRIRYAARPGRMKLDTDLAQCAPIATVTTGTTTTTLTTAGVFAGGNLVDVVASGPAHQAKAINATRAALVLQNTDLLETPIPGDYLSVADTSPFVPLPEELASALIHRVAGVILRAQGYDEEAAAQLGLAEDEIRNALPMLTPRNEGNPQIIRGGLRGALNQRNRGWRY